MIVNKKKPLSSYNLYFSYQRIKLVEQSFKAVVVNETSTSLSSLPGLEDVNASSPLLTASPDEIKQHRKSIIQHTISHSPHALPAQSKKRRHRKASNSDSLSFLEMNNHMIAQWAKADATTKEIFQEIADEKKREHQKMLYDLYRARCTAGAVGLNTSPKESSPSDTTNITTDVSNNLSSSLARTELYLKVGSTDTAHSAPLIQAVVKADAAFNTTSQRSDLNLRYTLPSSQDTVNDGSMSDTWSSFLHPFDSATAGYNHPVMKRVSMDLVTIIPINATNTNFTSYNNLNENEKMPQEKAPPRLHHQHHVHHVTDEAFASCGEISSSTTSTAMVWEVPFVASIVTAVADNAASTTTAATNCWVQLHGIMSFISEEEEDVSLSEVREFLLELDWDEQDD
eukprot:scaffold3217_cov221-Alexandrium_tamarense.AAC.11